MDRLKPAIFIRLGLGAMFAYSGIDIILHPSAWTWALNGLPSFLHNSINAIGAENYLRIQGGLELAMAAAFVAWFLPRWLVRLAALGAAIEMAAILAFVGIDAVTFRDLGLLGAVLALLVMKYTQTQ